MVDCKECYKEIPREELIAQRDRIANLKENVADWIKGRLHISLKGYIAPICRHCLDQVMKHIDPKEAYKD
jgi:hypothetical protein